MGPVGDTAPYFMQIGQMDVMMLQFLDFQDGRYTPFWSFKNANFYWPVGLGWPLCITIQMVMEILYLTVFKMVDVAIFKTVKMALSTILDFF